MGRLFSQGRMVFFLLASASLLALISLGPAWACNDSRAAPAGLDPSAYDGYLVGEGGCLYDPGSISLDQVPPFLGRTRSGPRQQPLFYVNGFGAAPGREPYRLRRLAESSNIPVIGIYYASQSQSLADILRVLPIPKSPVLRSEAINTLKDLMLSAMERGEAFHVRGGSGGTIIIADTLGKVRRAAFSRYGPQEAMNNRLPLLKVETHGSAASWYPSGPRYVHYINLLDPVPLAVGFFAPGLQNSGPRSAVALFLASYPSIESELGPVDGMGEAFLRLHGFNVYTRYRRPFDTIYDQSRRLPARGFVNLDRQRFPIEGI